MGVDYYKILQVDPSAKEDDLKKAYLLFSEAYDVISDPQKRAVYDQCREEGLKGQVPPPSSAGGTSFRFNPRSADDNFAEFFGFSSPIGGTGPSGGVRVERSPGGGMFGDDAFGGIFGSGPQRQQKAAAIENQLPCSLEDLYKGTTKKMKISREISDFSG